MAHPVEASERPKALSVEVESPAKNSVSCDRSASIVLAHGAPDAPESSPEDDIPLIRHL